MESVDRTIAQLKRKIKKSDQILAELKADAKKDQFAEAVAELVKVGVDRETAVRQVKAAQPELYAGMMAIHNPHY